jgi:hypothetical protein
MKRPAGLWWAVPTGLAVIVGLVVGAGLLGLRGGAAASTAPAADHATPTSGGTATLITPSGTGVVAKLPMAQSSRFAWAPDGAHLLVAGGDDYTTRIYDRLGKLLFTYGSIESWLDATHLIDGAGNVVALGAEDPHGPTANSRAVASGHGSAAVIVAVPACVGDPLIDWYRDGKYVKTGEKATPFGWSPDGRYVLVGHMDCGQADADLHGWKGAVQVIEFQSGKVVATLPGIRGEMAFNPDGTEVAAQSDGDLEVADLDSGEVDTLPNLRFLGWLDVESIIAVAGTQVEFVDLDPTAVSSMPGTTWKAESPTGLELQADLTGSARAILAQDGSTLLDLSAAGLVAERYTDPSGPTMTWLQQQWWSPDGRMLALRSADGLSLSLISVDPSQPAPAP